MPALLDPVNVAGLFAVAMVLDWRGGSGGMEILVGVLSCADSGWDGDGTGSESGEFSLRRDNVKRLSSLMVEEVEKICCQPNNAIKCSQRREDKEI